MDRATDPRPTGRRPLAGAGLVIAPDDPHADDVRRLLSAHLAFAGQHSPPEDVHALLTPGVASAAGAIVHGVCRRV